MAERKRRGDALAHIKKRAGRNRPKTLLVAKQRCMTARTVE
jgi:hypothetical protein